MISWKFVPSESPIKWFLEEENSLVRYFTLRDVLDRSERDHEAVTAKKAITFSPWSGESCRIKSEKALFLFCYRTRHKGGVRAFLAVAATDISDVLHRLLYSEGLDGEDHSPLWNHVF
jgi:hypothetical protein